MTNNNSKSGINSKDKKIESLEKEIEKELKELSKVLAKPINNKDKYLSTLYRRKNQLKWFNKKLDLFSAQMPKVVKQREIFYCELGQNIGSEQEGRRPVVILQNNVGNAHAGITLVAPVTSFRKGSLKTVKGQLYLEEKKNGKNHLKKLLFYDIPLELEKDSKYDIYGVANVSQIRVVSKSRLALTPVATITIKNFKMITTAIEKNISIFEENLDKN